ncbi:Sporulation initiation inhibitor protein soj [uncultured Clostridium sp.]|uniref:AAA family ATPase n=1 Tax=Muricoprocola aceti TaxID=2981772 RepID=A0ABT2SI82_9FIRM|nr:AAA family ATPase [Muricoprocola aceti]MCU6724224.1 AAA family ATPase [Muricoprocola aceti]SCH06709.1 Sporulation initiation inhibitor protein soj [uncultured Clostridium sp.]
MGNTKIIALFNNKGGVSKTTTTYNLGWMLSLMGKKTLIVDSDPQCNLTGICINSTKENKLEDLYKSDLSNIKSSIEPVFSGDPEPIKAANCVEFKENDNLFLLPGHIQFSSYDTTYNIAETMTGSLNLMKNVPGALRRMLELTAEKYSLDIILIDMSPSISATNANILMQSDYFIVPCAPDYFCYMAIESLVSIFPKWCETYKKMALNEIFQSATYKMKDKPPVFLGTIQQRYRPRNGSPARAFADWIADINNLVADKLIPVLTANDMFCESGNKGSYEEPYNLINIADFNSLIAQSQEHNTPVFLLTQEQVQKSGTVWDNMKRNRDEFYNTFQVLATRIIKAIEM